MNDPLIDPFGSQTDTKPTSEVVSEASDDFVDFTNNLIAPDDTVEPEGAVADAAEGITEISLDEPSDDFVDIFGSETAAPQEDVEGEDVAVEAAIDRSEMTSAVMDPLGDAEQEVKETFTAPVIAINDDSSGNPSKQPPGSGKIVDPLVDLLNDPLPTEAKNPSPSIDLFEDEGSDLFADPKQMKSAKQPETSLFGEPDEDLFGEPLGATKKKTTSKEHKDKSVRTKVGGSNDGSKIGGPLQEGNHGDIFSEEAVATAPSVSNTSSVNSKTNGVNSEEEADGFAGGSTICLM